MSTEFFASTETYDMSRVAWADATGLPENSSPEAFAQAFEKEFRASISEEFLHSWSPEPSLDQIAQLDKTVQEQSATIPIQTNTFEAGDTVVVEYTVTGSLAVSDTDRNRPDLDPGFSVSSPMPMLLAGGAAAGVGASLLVKKDIGLKLLVGVTAGLVGVVLTAQVVKKVQST